MTIIIFYGEITTNTVLIVVLRTPISLTFMPRIRTYEARHMGWREKIRSTEKQLIRSGENTAHLIQLFMMIGYVHCTCKSIGTGFGRGTSALKS